MTVSVNGAELFYSTRGTGPVCLVLSAIGTRPYERQMPAELSDRLQLVFVDVRGGGRSTGDPAGLSFDVLAEDVEAIRADLGVGKIAVLGHSILGILAIEVGRRCPATVSHVITVGTPPRGAMAWGAAQSDAFFEQDASEDRKQVLRDNLARLPAGASRIQSLFAQTPMRFFDARLDAAPLFEGAEANPDLLRQIMATLAPAWDVTARSNELTVPTFLAHGRYDYIVPYCLWDGIPEKLPNATFQLFERSGHQPFFEEPAHFAESVTAWMARQPAPNGLTVEETSR